jgi:hypothetical protein
MRTSSLVTGWLALLLVLSLAACGTTNVGTLTPGGNDHQVMGVQLGGFEVIRQNVDGRPDASLNRTLDLRLEQAAGQTALVISVTDADYTTAVTLDLKYDAARVHPVKAEFHGLLGDSGHALNAAFLDKVSGLAGLGEVAIGEYRPPALHGDLATVYFENGPARNVSAANNVYSSASVDYAIEHVAFAPGLDNLVGTSNPGGGTANVTWFCAWARADGNQDSTCSAADLVPIGANFGKTITTTDNFDAVPADYNDDSVINVQDVAPLGIHFNEITDQYLVEMSDDDVAATRTTVATLDWQDDGTAKAGTPTYPDLTTICRNWAVDWDGTTTPTFADLAALDAAGNANNKVRVWITPQEISRPPASDGTEAFVDLDVTVPGHTVNISGYDIQAVGATGGGGTGSDIFNGGDTADIVANQALTLQLNSVNGTFDGVAFDASTLPPGMNQAMYDMVLAAVADNLNWTFANVGDSNARFVGPWFVPANAGYTGTGDPGAGTVSPDDDPESTAPSDEGNAGTDLAAGSLPSGDPQVAIEVPATVDLTFGFDMAVDPLAPVIEGCYADPTQTTKLTMLEAGGAGLTVVFFKMDSWGATGSTIPADPTLTKLELHTQNAADTRDLSLSYELAWDDEDPPDQDPEAGEFFIFHNDILDIDIFICKVPAIQVTPGSSVAFRFNDGTTWSSINKPTDLLTTTPPVPPEDLLTLPADYDRNVMPPPYLQIFRNEPKIRRNGRVTMDTINGLADPKDPIGYADNLKTGLTSYDFPISYKTVIVGGHPVYYPYPIIVLKACYTEPDTWPTITGPDDPDAEANILIPLDGGREAGRICVDVTSLILNLDPPVMGNQTWCAYHLYDAADGDIGQGRFKIYDEPVEPVLPMGVEWGVNVGDRGDWNKLDFNTLCTNKAVNGTTMTTPTPDVLWVRFNGKTRVLDWNEYWSDDDPNTDNIQLVVQDSELAQSALAMYLVIVGITLNNDYIAIHHLDLNDGAGWYYDWVAAFPTPGILAPGKTYDLGIDDPTIAGIDFWFSDQLNVIGNNPNFP